MKNKYTKIILGIITFIWTLLGPVSIVIKPGHVDAQTAKQSDEIASVSPAHSIFSAGVKLEVSYHAATAATGEVATTPTTNKELAVTLEAFLKVVYVFLWPLLWIAGMAMDNSLVYGEIFGLDDALRKFWGIMKNFANFALGFLFVWSIAKFVINPNEKKHPKDIITKLLVGGILVNTSWFIIGALVDLSTVLTVGVGGLPLQLIGEQSIADKPIYGVKTSIRLNDTIGEKGNLVVLYTWPGAGGIFTDQKKYMLPCLLKEDKVNWDEDERKTAFQVSDGGNGNITGTNVKWSEVQGEYCILAGNVISKSKYNDTKLSNTAAMKQVYKDSEADLKTASNCDNNDTCQTLKSFTKKSEGYQSAFYSLYASLLNLATIHIGVPKSEVSLVMETLIKTLVALAYLIPLAILAIVLIMRIGFLWLIIAFSPFILLGAVKDLGIGGLKDGVKLGAIKTKFTLTNVISLLLLPVIVTFVISLSIVFLSSVSEGLTSTGTADSMGIYQRDEGQYKCYDVAITNICLDIPSKDVGTGIFDYFSWTIMNLFGIGLMWFSVMAALKSSEFTKGVATSVQNMSENMLMSAPVIPIPGGKSTSLSALKELPRDLEGRIDQSNRQSQNVLSESIMGVVNDKLGKDNAVSKKLNDATVDLTKNSASSLSTLEAGIRDGSYNAPSKMDFGQVDGSAKFATALAGAVGSKATFANGQDLFTTDAGHQVLGSLVAKTGVSTSNLRSMYSGKENISNDDWSAYEEAILRYSSKEKTLADAEKKRIEDEKKKNAKQVDGAISKTKLFVYDNKIAIENVDTPKQKFKTEADLDNIIKDINTLLSAKENKDGRLVVEENYIVESTPPVTYKLERKAGTPPVYEKKKTST